MKVAVVGAGAIGLLVSYFISKSGIDLHVVTRREEQAERINKNGIILIDESGNADHTSVFAHSIDYINLTHYDIVIFTVKSHQLPDVLDEVELEGVKTVLFLQNGMGHVSLFSTLRVPTIATAVVEHGALRKNDWSVIHTGIGRIRWSYVKKHSFHLQNCLERVASPRFPIELEDDWKRMLETKLVVNACINPLTTILQVENGELIKNKRYKKMMRALFLEVVEILERDDREELWEIVTTVCEKTEKNRSSMLVDCESNRKTEVDSILGYIMERGKENKKSMTLTTFLYDGVKGKEWIINEEDKR